MMQSHRFLLQSVGIAVLGGLAHAQPIDPAAPPTAPEPAPVVTSPFVPPPPPAPAEPAPGPKPETDSDAPTGRWANMGLLFNLNNVFTSGSVLTGYQGFGLGLQVAVAPRSVLRFGVELGRATDPVNVVKTTRQNGADVVVSYDLELPASGFSSQHAAVVAVDMLKVMSGRKVAPYIGAGLFAAYLDRDLDYVDDLTVVDQITNVQTSSDTFSTGLRGILGVNWRIGDRFALFAEYHLRVEAIAIEKVKGETTISNNIAGTPATSRVTTEFEETRYLNVDLGLGQGGALGLVAYF